MTKKKKLTAHMQGALDMIAAGGGCAKPRGGGYWEDGQGRLLTAPNGRGETSSVGTRTIYYLVDLGLIASAVPQSNARARWGEIGYQPPHRRTYWLTKEEEATA